MTFSIPTHKCGLVIGRGKWLLHRPHPSPHFPPALCSLPMASAGGENVKAINQQTGAFVEISRQLPPNGDPNFKLFIIRGSPQQIDHAKQLIEEKIEVGSAQEGFWVLGPSSSSCSTDLSTFHSSRVPSAQSDQARGDQALPAPWGPSTPGPSIRAHLGLPLSEYSCGLLGCGGHSFGKEAQPAGPVSMVLTSEKAIPPCRGAKHNSGQPLF